MDPVEEQPDLLFFRACLMKQNPLSLAQSNDFPPRLRTPKPGAVQTIYLTLRPGVDNASFPKHHRRQVRTILAALRTHTDICRWSHFLVAALLWIDPRVGVCMSC